MTVTTEQRWLSATSQTLVGVLNRCTELPVLNALEHSWPEHLGVCAVTKTNYSDVSHLCPLPQPEPHDQSKESLKYKPFLPSQACFNVTEELLTGWFFMWWWWWGGVGWYLMLSGITESEKKIFTVSLEDFQMRTEPWTENMTWLHFTLKCPCNSVMIHLSTV